MSISFYRPLSNATGLTGFVGGQISTGRLYGVLNELFAHVPSPPSGTIGVYNQYRKVYIKNEYVTPVINIVAWVEGAEHPEQLYLGLETSTSQEITGALIAPSGISGSGWYTTSGYGHGMPIGSMGPSAATGIWIKQELSGINYPDPYATFTLKVGGQVL